MANAYFIKADGSTEPMTRVHCENEDLELQLILEKNPELLPGDQIDPENPRRWLLIKREMPVPNPNTGSDRWSIDFLFADQDAIPTFVECKRFKDTRSRREVVGQMFEYAANGHYYWTKEMLQDFAEQTAKQKGLSLQEAIRGLGPTDFDSAEAFFERLQENLREGQVRIVFYLDESPMELRSMVDFLNKQMERSEVLLVEARQYSYNGSRIVVPTLFGYTEEARSVKRIVTVTTAGSRTKWDKTSYFSDALRKLTGSNFQAVEAFYGRCLEMGFEIDWGTGKDNGSFSVKELSISQKSLLSVQSNGKLILNFGWLNGNERVEKARDRFKELVVQKTGIRILDDYARHYITYSIAEWSSKTEALAEVLRDLRADFGSLS